MSRFRRISLWATAGLLAVVLLPQTSSQPANRAGSEQTQAAVLLGTSLGILFHELGHALIGELQLPVTGPEEDVADEFSAITMGQALEDGDADATIEGMVRYASLLWYYMALQPGAGSPWQAEHSPDIRRFRHTFCLIYGSAPSRFERLADGVGFEVERRQRCISNYHRKKLAWERILQQAYEDAAANSRSRQPSGEVTIEVWPASTPLGRIVQTLFSSKEMKSDLANMLEDEVRWPRDFTIEFRDCPNVNAWYDPAEGKVTMCYSMIEYATNLVFQAEGIAPTLAAPVNHYAEGAAYLLGTWVAQVPTPQGLLTATASYAADFTFQLDTAGIQTVGRWDVEHAGRDMLTLHTIPTDWYPRAYVDEYGRTQPIAQEPSQTVVRVLDANTVDSEGAIWRRQTGRP